MSPPIDLDDPIAVLLAAADAVAAAGVEAAAYGGLALAVYGEPRETRDVTFGGHSVARIAIVRGDQVTGLNTVDLVTPRSARYARAALARAVRGTLRGRSIAVLSPDDHDLEARFARWEAMRRG